jgi:gliding motility-associated protein GldM
MASGKLSPRQKMINMMYLVLTALLALNISNEILDSFIKLTDSLEVSSNSFDLKNNDYAEGIQESIENEMKNGDSLHAGLLVVLKEVRQKSSSIQQHLKMLTTDIEQIAEKDPKTGEIKSKDERDKNYRYWMGANDVSNGGHGNGKAAELRTQLDEFTQWASQIYAKYKLDSTTKNPIRPLTAVLSGSQGEHGGSSNDTWEYATFHGTPVVADLAMLEKYQLDVKEIESQLLGLLRQRVDGPVYKINKLMAMEAPTARIVPAGLNFETRLFVGMSSDNINPEFLGSGIKLDQGGKTATMTLPANGSVIPQGKNEGIQHYKATIKVPRSDGKMEELELTGEFIVRKPEVVVRSRALQVLYKDCGNTVSVDVPALGDAYAPDFSRSQGGRIITANSSVRDITIVPNRPEFNLSVYSNTNGQKIKIDDLKYSVKKTPKPILTVEVSGRPYDGRSPVKKNQNIVVKLVPDADFKRELPKDARYKVSKVNILYASGLMPPRKVITTTGNIMEGISINLNQGDLRNCQDGDRIYVEIEDPSRVNFEGQTFAEPMSRYECTLAMTIKR